MALILFLAVGACSSGNGALQKIGNDYAEAFANYRSCLREKDPEDCRQERAVLDANADRVKLVLGASAPQTSATTTHYPAVYQPVGGGTVIRY